MNLIELSDKGLPHEVKESEGDVNHSRLAHTKLPNELPLHLSYCWLNSDDEEALGDFGATRQKKFWSQIHQVEKNCPLNQ